MLILSRRVGETMVIGDDVRVTVLGIMNGQVRLGTAAPITRSVHREEVYERIKREHQDRPAPVFEAPATIAPSTVRELLETLTAVRNQLENDCQCGVCQLCELAISVRAVIVKARTEIQTPDGSLYEL